MNLHYVTPDNREVFAAWLTKGHKLIGLDTETTGLDPWNDTLRMVQFGDLHDGWALPWPQEGQLISNVLKFYPGRFAMHNAKFDCQFLHMNGFDVPLDRVDDTRILLALHVSPLGNNKLKDNADYYFPGAAEPQLGLLEAMKKNKWNWETIPQDFELYWRYAAADAVLTAKLADLMAEEVIAKHGKLYQIEQTVWQQMLAAERYGLQVDQPYVLEKIDQLEGWLQAVRERWSAINLGSPKQVAEYLTSQGVTLPKTEKGNPKTDDAVLSTLAAVYPLAKDVLEYRRILKLLSTYFINFVELSDAFGYIHPNINTIGAKTGRMSCERPNLQNVPHTAYVRDAFQARDGHVFVSADYDQIEYRIFASMANETDLIQGFLDGEDIHTTTARLIFGHDPSYDERTIAKTANYCILFGGGPAKFASTSGLSIPDSYAFLDRYNEAIPAVKNYMTKVVKYLASTGSNVYTLDGRSIPVEPQRLYAGVNYAIQGTAADVLKQAICRVAETEWRHYLVLPVHDELLFDVPAPLAPKLMKELPDLMEDRDRFAVPLTVEVSMSKKWGDKYAKE